MIFLSSADFFQNHLFRKILAGIPSFQNHLFRKIVAGIPSKCQTVWIQIRRHSVGSDLGPNCLQRLSADNTSR